MACVIVAHTGLDSHQTQHSMLPWKLQFVRGDVARLGWEREPLCSNPNPANLASHKTIANISEVGFHS